MVVLLCANLSFRRPKMSSRASYQFGAIPHLPVIQQASPMGPGASPAAVVAVTAAAAAAAAVAALHVRASLEACASVRRWCSRWPAAAARVPCVECRGGVLVCGAGGEVRSTSRPPLPREN